MQSEGKTLSATQLLLQAEQRSNQRSDATPALKVEMLAIIGESLFSLQENKESARVIEEALRLQQSIPAADPLLTARLHLALSKSREFLGDNDAAAGRAGEDLRGAEAPRGRRRDRSRCAPACTRRRSAWHVNDYSDHRARREAGHRRSNGGDGGALRRSRHGADVPQQGLHLHRTHAGGRGACAPGTGPSCWRTTTATTRIRS